MCKFIGCDAHKRYSVFVEMDATGRTRPAIRIEHDREQFRAYLATLPTGAVVALETTGNWYWMVEEIERAGLGVRLADAAQAKARMGNRKKTDKVDARGLAELLRVGTLPSVWIPPAGLLDLRETVRLRMRLVQQRTRFKDRVHALLANYLLLAPVTDMFGVSGHQWLQRSVRKLPSQTRQSVEQQVELIDELTAHIRAAEMRMEAMMPDTPELLLLQTAPGIGPILSLVILLHTGAIERFPSAGHYAGYSGLVPSVHSSGGHTWFGPARRDINHYLRWAFVEAANVVVLQQKRLAGTHVVALYRRVKQSKGIHAKATVAVARHLAQAVYCMLKDKVPYADPRSTVSSSSR
jgi:transposase